MRRVIGQTESAAITSGASSLSSLPSGCVAGEGSPASGAELRQPPVSGEASVLFSSFLSKGAHDSLEKLLLSEIPNLIEMFNWDLFYKSFANRMRKPNR